MKDERALRDMSLLTGLSAAELAVGELHVYCFLGDEVEHLGKAASIDGAMSLLRTQAFAGGEPSPEDVDAFPLASSLEDPVWRSLAYVLSDACLMERTVDEQQLTYLASVIDESPALRLLIAWEAAPPHQDAAFGIFVPRST